MKVLLVVDGSSYSIMATEMVESLRLPSQTEITIMTVVPEHTFLGGITFAKLWGASPKKMPSSKKRWNCSSNRLKH